MAFEILIRGIDDDGNAEEQDKITLEDGSLPERVLILAEGAESKEAGIGKTVLCKAGCDDAEICMMIHHNKEMKSLVRVYMMGEMAMRMLRTMDDGDEENIETQETEMSEEDIADGIGQALSPA